MLNYLEDEGLLGGELGQLEAVLPLLVPADDAPLQQERLSHSWVPPSLLLQQYQRCLACTSVTCEPGTRVVVSWPVQSGGQGVLTQGDQLSWDGRHLHWEQTLPVDIHGLSVVESWLQDEADIFSWFLAPAQRLQHHLDTGESGKNQWSKWVRNSPRNYWSL